MGKYIKLGEKARSFADPTTLFRISGKQVKEVTAAVERSKKFMQAKKKGHLETATAEEYENFQKGIANSSSTNSEEKKVMSTDDLKNLKKDQIVDQILKDFEQEKSKNQLSSMSKDELIEYYFECEEETEEEEDED